MSALHPCCYLAILANFFKPWGLSNLKIQDFSVICFLMAAFVQTVQSFVWTIHDQDVIVRNIITKLAKVTHKSIVLSVFSAGNIQLKRRLK